MRAAFAACLLPLFFSPGTSSSSFLSSSLPQALPFLKALDLSYLGVLDCGGECSPFRARAGGPPVDALAQVAAAGVNAVRLRLWVNPSPRTPSPWPSDHADYTYANLSNVAALARRVQARGLALWLDLHFSDVWADPGHQTKPAAWAALTLVELTARVASWTGAAVAALVAQGTPPLVVQVGNEITAGLLWAAAPEPCSQGGALFAASCDQAAQWAALRALVAAGCGAVRAAAPGATILIHTDLGNRLPGGLAYINEWYTSLALPDEVWDGIALSFYPNWGAGVTQNVLLLSAVKAAFPRKRLVLAETAYAYKDGPTGGQFPHTPRGQADYLISLLNETRAVGGDGAAYWGGEFYYMADGSGWSGIWDEAGVPLPALTEPWRER